METQRCRHCYRSPGDQHAVTCVRWPGTVSAPCKGCAWGYAVADGCCTFCEADGPTRGGFVRLAYADPPYPGQAKRHYGDHEDFAGEVDHADLIARLTEFDGWALSTSNRALQDVLALCPPGVRILSWCKPIAPPMSGHGVFGWEPVIVSWARPPASDLRDTITVSPEQYTFRPKPEGYVTGAKPPAFSRWLFRWLGAQPGDDFTDMFPGSRAVSDAWTRFTSSPTLEAA